jgi:hypothetical protein
MDIPKDVTDNLYSGENVIYCIKRKLPWNSNRDIW